MATAQQTPNKASKARQPARDRESDTEELSGERDEHYDLISVIYHGLQGADQCVLYAEDAEDAGDRELAEFLHASAQQQAAIAKQAKQLLLERLSESESTERSGRAGRATSFEDEEEDEVG